jgi:predicted ArsR family transcriptional regulator
VPTPNETEILRITKKEKEVDKILISSRMGISCEYSAHLLNYLVRKNFLEEAPAKEGTHRTVPRYRLTRKGALALLAGLHHAAGKYALAVRRTLFLKSAIDEKINELTDYIEKEFPKRKMWSKNRGKNRASVSGPVRVR